MNDPGLDKNISEDAKDVENQRRDEKEEKEEDEQEFLKPSRWWFASTAFPLIAGTFGPMASAFSILALVTRWRSYIPPGSSEDTAVMVDDPKWLIGVNAAQLVIALISNLFLLLNMARRVRFSIAQPVTIIGWYVSSFALIGLCACASGPLIIEPKSDHAFTQAYYYAIISAGLYFLVATLMLITVWGASRGEYDKEFQLTMSQRTLMLQTISFLVYLLAGAAVYSHIEGWGYLDAVYWADFTLLTVGIGDFSPSTHLGRGLLFPFAIGGIIILGLVIGSIRSLVLERGKVKMGARMVEKERRRILKKLEKGNNSEVLQPIENGTPTTSRTLHDDSTGVTERQRREKEFELMRQIQEQAHNKRRWTSLVISGSTWFILWFAGAAIFQACEKDQEGFTYFVSLYFSYTSLLTIGYGDFYPRSNSGKPFFVFWSLLAIPSLTILISNMGDTIVKGIRDLTLWIGNLTVLPGEQGLRANLKSSANTVSRGRLFNNNVSEQPPGILGETKRNDNDESDGENGNRSNNNPESAAQRVTGDRSSRKSKNAKKEGEQNDRLPKSQRHYQVMLIQEISKVIKHLDSSPPRKYTFDEWAWYLKLIGEDESSSDTHRKAPRKPKPDGEGLGAAMQDKEVQWSWVGNRSPLMGNKEEAEWVLERLTTTLSRELSAMHREELEANGGRKEDSTYEVEDEDRSRSGSAGDEEMGTARETGRRTES